jgi:hypothetical protein
LRTLHLADPLQGKHRTSQAKMMEEKHYITIRDVQHQSLAFKLTA